MSTILFLVALFVLCQLADGVLNYKGKEELERLTVKDKLLSFLHKLICGSDEPETKEQKS